MHGNETKKKKEHKETLTDQVCVFTMARGKIISQMYPVLIGTLAY